MNNLPANYNIQWNTSSNLTYTSYNNAGYFATLYPNGNGNGTGSFEAVTIRSSSCDCGNISLDNSSVWVGLPVAISSLEGEEVGFPDACTNETLHMTIIDDNVSALTNYIWTLYGATMTYHNSNYSSVNARMSSVPRRYDFQIKASNSCGTLSVQHFYGQVQD